MYAVTSPLEAVGIKKTMFVVTILPKATAAPEIKTGEIGATVADGGAVGKLVLTFDQQLGTEPKFFAGGRHAADTQLVVNCGDYDESAKTLQVRTFVTGSLADMADDADSEVSVLVVMNQTGADDGAD